MKAALLTFALLLGHLHATSIDVSCSTNTLLHAGDSVSFELFTWNYAAAAQAFGLPINPSDILFTLISAPVNPPPALAAYIESPDQSFSLAFAGPLLFTAGYVSSASFEGPVSALTGHLHFSDADSLSLFNSAGVSLRFLNEGADFDLGLPPQILQSDLFASLSGGALSVGALPGRVSKQSPVLTPGVVPGFDAFPEFSVPEPGSPVLMLGGGVLLVAVSRLLRRVHRGSR